MRTFSSTVSSLLSQDVVKFFLLIDLKFSSNHYLTTLPYSFTFLSADGVSVNYSVSNSVLEYDPPKLSSVVDREAYRLVLSDLSDTMLGEMKTGIIGKEMSVRLGFLDSSDQPITNSSDILYIYKGFIY